MTDFTPIVPSTVPCKICGGISRIFGVVDFNKNCEAGHNRFPLPPAGIPIYYHRCSVCALLFTVAFDEFSKDDFSRHIYNDSYKLVDPEYAEIRPAGNAQMLASTFGQTPAITTLDYGGGNGKTAELLRSFGFFNVRSYDPFFPGSGALPTQKFQMIVCFEVLEHTPTPIATFTEMFSLLADDGMILFSTLTQPPNIDQIGLNWSYAGPRNGHVTLYSVQSLQVIGKKFGTTYASAGEGRHVFFKTVPDFARHLIR